MRGPNVMAGYHELPDETGRGHCGPDGWLRTGDLVTMDDRGYLRMAGRLKEMIVSGARTSSRSRSRTPSLEHPDVAQVAVVGVPDRRWGESAVAVVVPAAGPGPPVAAAGLELEAFLRDRLAAFKVPRRWVFVDELPRTASGKVQKHVLRDQLVARR